MPIAKLVFKLPEEIEEYRTTMNAGRYSSALWEMREYLRTLRKYPQDGLQDKRAQQVIELIAKQFHEIIEELDL